ncbi:hypothetical protein SDC9_105838 [bioreactor metagenome]|uniref:Uncharacterized protein n=1 Tax=bioreactor metagenome TaxID=1076179 RepID=A0A645B366_9ZZZZ
MNLRWCWSTSKKVGNGLCIGPAVEVMALSPTHLNTAIPVADGTPRCLVILGIPKQRTIEVKDQRLIGPQAVPPYARVVHCIPVWAVRSSDRGHVSTQASERSSREACPWQRGP